MGAKLRIAIAAFLASSCATAAMFERYGVPGPESEDVPGVRGTLLMEETDHNGSAALKALAFPTERETTPVPMSAGRVARVSAPDLSGTAVYVVDYYHEKRFSLIVVDLVTGERSELFSRAGKLESDYKLGRYIALSPTSGMLAFASDFDHRTGTVGNLEVWNLGERRRLDVTRPLHNRPLSWFPDGSRLAFVDDIDCEKANRLFPEQFHDITSPLGRVFCGSIEAIGVLTIATGEVTYIGLGIGAIISSTGRQAITLDASSTDFLVIASDAAPDAWHLVDLETGRTTRIHAPGLLAPLAFDDETLIYWGLPTDGTERRTTTGNSPVVGPKLMLSIKAAHLPSRRFRSLVNFVDPRTEVAFGAWPGPAN